MASILLELTTMGSFKVYGAKTISSDAHRAPNSATLASERDLIVFPASRRELENQAGYLK